MNLKNIREFIKIGSTFFGNWEKYSIAQFNWSRPSIGSPKMLSINKTWIAECALNEKFSQPGWLNEIYEWQKLILWCN